MARRTLADQGASEASRLYATQILRQAGELNANVTVKVEGSAGHREAHDGAYEGTVRALELFGIQVGGAPGGE